MLKRTTLILPIVFLVTASPISMVAASGAHTPAHGHSQPRLVIVDVTGSTDREQDGLVGPVRRVRTETAKIASREGKPIEGQRTVLETATYDLKGVKIDNAYFLAGGGSLTGREEYTYDNRGNIIEMTLRNSDGSILSKETYAYEFDAVGNWTKMTTSVGVIEGGRLTFEPTEVTYRSIAYYLEENVAKLVQNAPANAVATAPASNPASTPAIVPAAGKPANTSAKPAASANTVNSTAAASPPNAAPKKTDMVVPPSAASAGRASFVGAPIGGQANVAANLNASSAPVVKVDDEAPSAPRPKAPVKPVSGGILNGKATSLPTPVYPEMAKRARTVGLVSVEVVIDVTGKVISAKATSGPALLHAAAENAARQARFSPTLLSGQPVKVAGTISYNFSLAQ